MSERVLVAGALVAREDGILFVRQTYPPYVGMWGFPTGLVDPGELLHEAAVRETKEEAGITAEAGGVVSVYSIAQERPLLYVVLLCAHLSGEPVPDGRENDRAAYLSRAEVESLRPLIIPPCDEIADLYWRGEAHPLPPRGEIAADGQGKTVRLYL